jgi:hypothetical protein
MLLFWTAVITLQISRQSPADTDTVTTGAQTDQQTAYQDQLTSLLGQVGDFTIGGAKFYLGGTPFFAFGEGQITWILQANGNDGDFSTSTDTPWIRAYGGVGYGKIKNIAQVMKVKKIEKYLTEGGVISRPFTRKTQRKLYYVFEKNTNSTAAMMKAVDIMKNDGYLGDKNDLTVEKTFAITQIIDDSYKYRQEGLEAKAGVIQDILVPYVNSGQTWSTGIGLYAEWQKPLSDRMQLTLDGNFSQIFYYNGSLPTNLFVEAVFNYKVSRDLTLQFGDRMLLTTIAGTCFINSIFFTSRYYLAENIDLSVTASNNNATPDTKLPAEMFNIGLNFTYTVPIDTGY